jgi:glutathione S-transferase
MQAIQAISLMGWFGSGIHPHLSRINGPLKFCDTPGSAESVRLLASKQLLENFQIADNLLSAREFFFDHFTAVDSYFYWCFRRGKQFKLSLDQFSNCTLHFSRMEERESVRKLLAFEAQTLANFATFHV